MKTAPPLPALGAPTAVKAADGETASDEPKPSTAVGVTLNEDTVRVNVLDAVKPSRPAPAKEYAVTVRKPQSDIKSNGEVPGVSASAHPRNAPSVVDCNCRPHAQPPSSARAATAMPRERLGCVGEPK